MRYTVAVALRLSRAFSTTNCHQGKKALFFASRESRYLQKLLNRKPVMQISKEDKGEEENLSIRKVAFVQEDTRRTTVLNKLFMTHITDMLCTEPHYDLLNKGLEVTHVKVQPNLKYVNIFWTTSSTIKEEDKPTDELLTKCAMTLKHQLSRLKVMSSVPKIRFIKNTQLENINEVFRRLENLDLEEKPEIPWHEQLSDFKYGESADNIANLAAELAAEINLKKQATKNIDFFNEEEEIQLDDDLPVMINNTFGLDHTKMMNFLIMKLNKSRTTPVFHSPIPSFSHEDSEESAAVAEYLTQKEEKEAFSQFLKTRKVQDKFNRSVDKMDMQEVFRQRDQLTQDLLDHDPDNHYYDEYEKDYEK